MAVYDPEKPKTLTPGADGSHDNLSAHSERSGAGVADLENQFGAPSVAEGAEASLFNDSETSTSTLQGIFTKKRAAGGGIVGIIIGLVFGGMTIISGPMQFIHIAQLLQKFHFSSLTGSGDDRMVKIARYIKNKGDERTRMGSLGNKMADKIETKFNATGIESSYGDAHYLDGYNIDRAKIPADSELASIKSLTPEEAKLSLETRYKVSGVTITSDGKFHIPADDLGYFKSRALVSSMMDDAGYSKVTTAIGTRVMGKRAGIDWHPMKKLDRKVNETLQAKLTEWRKNQQAEVDGDGLAVTTTEDKPTSTDDSTPPASDEDIAKTKATADATVTEAEGVSKDIASGAAVDAPGGALAKFQASTSLKVAGGLTAAVGVACMVKGISDNMDMLQHAKIVVPLMRMGMQAITLGNQVMTGKDMDMEQLSFFAKRLNDTKTNTSWTQAKSIQSELGQPQTGPDMPADAKVDPKGNVISQFIAAVPGLGPVCKTVNSTAGQVAGFAISFVGAPVSATVGIAAGFATGPIIERISRWIVGHPIDINVAGANYGNYINYGARLSANDQAIATGGRKLNPVETAQLREVEIDTNQADQQKKSFADRMLNPYDSSSLLSSIIDKQSPTISSNTLNLASAITRVGNVFGSLIQTFSSIISTNKVRAAAQTSYDYGFSQYGFSISEMNDPNVNNPFDNAKDVADLLAGANGASYMSRVSKCFGVTLSADGSVAGGNSTPLYSDIDKSDCGDSSTDWLRIRMYLLDMNTMEAAACWNGDTQSCENSGFSGGSLSDATDIQGMVNPPSIGSNLLNDIGLYFKPNAN